LPGRFMSKLTVKWPILSLVIFMEAIFKSGAKSVKSFSNLRLILLSISFLTLEEREMLSPRI